MTNLQEEILRLLNLSIDGLTARELANKIRYVDKTAINHELYGELSSKCKRNEHNYRWSIIRKDSITTSCQSTIHVASQPIKQNITSTKITINPQPTIKVQQTTQKDKIQIAPTLIPEQEPSLKITISVPQKTVTIFEEPDPIIFHLTQAKIKLLRDDNLYQELLGILKQENEKIRYKVEQISKWLSIVFIALLDALLILFAILGWWKDWHLFVLFVSTCSTKSLYNNLNKLFRPKVSKLFHIDYSRIKIGAIKYVEVTQGDRENYLKYLVAEDEYKQRELQIEGQNVSFSDGEIIIHINSRKTDIRIPCAEAKKVFKDYISMVKEELPNIKVRCYSGQYLPVNLDEVVYILRVIIKTKEIEDEKIDKRRKEELQKQEEERARKAEEWRKIEAARLLKENSLRENNLLRASYINQQTIIITLKSYKSEYFSYLVDQQSKGRQIYSLQEDLTFLSSNNSTKEKAYIFTLDKSSGYYVIFENANENRATIVCEVANFDLWVDCIEKLSQYMTSSRYANKRQTLHSTHTIQGLNIRILEHNDIGSWKSQLFGRSQIVKKRIYKKYRKGYWRRWY